LRELRTAERLRKESVSPDQLRWALKVGRWTVVIRGVYGRGPDAPSELDKARAIALQLGGVAVGLLAAALHAFDGAHFKQPEIVVQRNRGCRREGVRRVKQLPEEVVVVGQVQCLPASDTLHMVAGRVGDDLWEQMLEYCLRKKLVVRRDVEEWAQGRSRSARQIRRVINARRGIDVRHTDSLLETLAIQLIRAAGLPTPVRQYEVRDPGTGRVVARCDLAWPELGIFIELDGQQHKDQPVYDARRQTLITTITHWQCGRLTWEDVVVKPEWGLAQIQGLLGCLVP